MQDKGEFGTAANHYFSALYHEAVRQGVDAAKLAIEVGIDLSVLDNPNARIRTELLANFQRVIWDQTQDESMGMCPFPMRYGTYYMMGKMTVHQPILQKALALGARFYNLVVTDDFISLRQEGTNTVLAVNHITPIHDSKHLLAEIALLSWHRYASWLIADSLPLTEIRFNYPAPTYANEYTYLFPGQHVFDANELALVFPTAYLQRPTKQNDGSLKSFMSRCPLELFRRYKADYSLTTELKRLLNKQITSNNTSVDSIADQLHMTTRTLMRKLKDEGTTFLHIKNLVRRDRAIHLLTHYTIPINEVAEHVGFSDPAVFTRAFRSWTGKTPKQYRDSQ